MSWSLNDISFRMAGSGSWQNLLPDTESKQLYGNIYPGGMLLSELENHFHALIQKWHRGNIIKLEDQKLTPLGPIITDEDIGILDPWFKDISDAMCAAVSDHLHTFQSQATDLAKKGTFTQEKYENILTIQICAHTLDSWVFSQLRREMMGTYSPRDFAGTFFFWGYAFANGPDRIFGFSTYGGRAGLGLHVLRSHGLNREPLKILLRQYDTHKLLQQMYAVHMGESPSLSISHSLEEKRLLESMRRVNIIDPEDPFRLAIPVFTNEDMTPAGALYREVTDKIVARFMAQMPELRKRIEKCSFSHCLGSDIYCMLFHLAYSYAADQLVERGTIPDFPQSPGAEWGVWIH
jgi:hypothetical protein